MSEVSAQIQATFCSAGSFTNLLLLQVLQSIKETQLDPSLASGDYNLGVH